LFASWVVFISGIGLFLFAVYEIIITIIKACKKSKQKQ